MLKPFLIIVGLIAVAIALFCIKLFFGRKFVNMHIDGNKSLNKKGIHCVQSMDARERQENPNRVSEKHCEK